MAATLTLTDGTTSLNLIDGTNYTLLQSGVSMPPPPRRFAWSGESLLRDGEKLSARQYGNRTVTLRLKIIGSSHDNLAVNVQAIQQMLETAQNTAKRGYGSAVELQYKWTNATDTVEFDVLDGELLLPTSLNSIILTRNLVVDAALVLTCKPFARGAQESVENYMTNPDFELWVGSVADNWAIVGGAGATVAKETAAANVKQGSASALVTRNGANVTWAQDLAAVTLGLDGNTVTLGIWVKTTGAANVYFRLTDNVTGGANTSAHTGGGAWELLTVSWAQPAAQATLRISLNIENSDQGVYVDKGILVKASSLPVAWVSGRALVNAYEQPEGAGFENRINYFDITDIPGDVPARLNLYAEESAAFTTDYTETLRPNAAGTTTGLSVNTGTNWGAVDEATADDATTYVYILGGNALDTYALPVPTGKGEIQSVTVYMRCRYTSSGTLAQVKGAIRTYATDYEEAAYQNLTASWAAYSAAWTTNPATTLAWTWEEIAALEAGLRLNGTGGFQAECTQVYVEVAYRKTNVWFGARRGSRRTDIVWYEGEDFAGIDSTQADAGVSSADNFGRVAVATGETAALPQLITKAITTPPQGLFRMLVRAKIGTAGEEVGIGPAWAFGSQSSQPAVAGDYGAVINQTFWDIYDAGAVWIYPTAVPDGITAGSYTLKLAAYNKSQGGSINLDVDWVMLMPADEGIVMLRHPDSAVEILLDGITDPEGIALLDTSTGALDSLPDAVLGTPPGADIGGMRVWVVGNQVKGTTWTLKVTHEPLYIYVRGD